MQHFEDILQERVHNDLCCNLRCMHPQVDPLSAKTQVSRSTEKLKKQNDDSEEE